MTTLALSSAVAVTAGMLAAVAPNQVWLRLPFGLPLVLLLPGYGLVRAVYRQPARHPLDVAVISVGLSLALTVLLGLALGPTSEGLRSVSWVIALAGFTIVANSLAYASGVRPPLRRREAPHVRLRPGLVVPATLAACVLVLSVAVSARDAFRPASGEIIQLWALPKAGGGPDDVQVGVSNKLSEARFFHLLILHADTVLADKSLDLPAGTSLVFSVRVPPGASGLTPVRAVLTATEPRESERMVTLWPSEPATATLSGK